MSRGVNLAVAEGISDEAIGAFWAKVDVRDPGSCWRWTGAANPKGYGNVTLNGLHWKAHRLAWTLANFPIPDGFVVCHACDTPSCCNPGHLLLGSPRANFTDMVRKSRAEFSKNKAIGIRNCNAKLTDAKVAAIRSDYQDGKANQYELAARYGVSQAAIGAVVRHKTWRHVHGK